MRIDHPGQYAYPLLLLQFPGRIQHRPGLANAGTGTDEDLQPAQPFRLYGSWEERRPHRGMRPEQG